MFSKLAKLVSVSGVTIQGIKNRFWLQTSLKTHSFDRPIKNISIVFTGANSSSDTELAESKNEDAAESEIKVTDENEFSASVLLDEESKGKLNQEEQQTLSTENASERPDANLLSEGVSPVQSVAANSQAPSKVFPSCSRFRGKIRGKVRGRRKASFSSQPFPTSLKDPLDPPPLFEEEPPSGPDVYYFESDHVALKHNSE